MISSASLRGSIQIVGGTFGAALLWPVIPDTELPPGTDVPVLDELEEAAVAVVLELGDDEPPEFMGGEDELELVGVVLPLAVAVVAGESDALTELSVVSVVAGFAALDDEPPPPEIAGAARELTPAPLGAALGAALPAEAKVCELLDGRAGMVRGGKLGEHVVARRPGEAGIPVRVSAARHAAVAVR